MRRRKKASLRFQQRQSRPPISRETCAYLLDHLPKILKIGTEFEINLPSAEDNLQQPAASNKQCVHALENQPCMEDCANLETCLTHRHPTFCLTRETGMFMNEPFQCPAKSDDDVEACRECPAWQLNCRGLDCSAHTPFCSICPSFSRPGQKNVEDADIRHGLEGTLCRCTGYQHIVNAGKYAAGKLQQAGTAGD